MSFEEWLRTFLDEKGIDLEETFEVETPSNWYLVDVGSLVEFLEQVGPLNQHQIKSTFVLIDFKNGDVRHYIDYLIRGMVYAHEEQEAES